MANGTIAFDTLQTSGQIDGTARSIDTDYLLMGTNKAWSNIVYTSAAPVIRDSFNSSSVADTQGGEFTVSLSNNMANDAYVCVAATEDFSVEHQSPAITTSTYAIRTVADSSGDRADVGNGTHVFTLITGELT